MPGPSISAHVERPHLALVINRKTNFFPDEDLYMEHPTGAFRGLMFAMLFNLALGAIGVLVWQLWRVLR
ncbi:hypothetical protein [Silvibacterium sp.]|uniref:hypothetical protein n=1 Tax=Silvibacterium sp. TaxID=1964179 RepID=UPI0039E719EB